MFKRRKVAKLGPGTRTQSEQRRDARLWTRPCVFLSWDTWSVLCLPVLRHSMECHVSSWHIGCPSDRHDPASYCPDTLLSVVCFPDTLSVLQTDTAICLMCVHEHHHQKPLCNCNSAVTTALRIIMRKVDIFFEKIQLIIRETIQFKRQRYDSGWLSQSVTLLNRSVLLCWTLYQKTDIIFFLIVILLPWLCFCWKCKGIEKSQYMPTVKWV